MRANFRAIEFLAVTTALIAPNFALSQEAMPVPPAADAEYSRNWGLPMINALPAYEQGYTGEGATIAVIEAGFDVNLTETATLGLAYQGQIASDAQEHGFNAKPRNSFLNVDPLQNA